MKTFYILAVFILALTKTYAQNNVIEIIGNTNINNFKCENNISENKNEIFIFTNADLPELEIDVNNFNCHNKVMTKDLKKTLAANQFPNMYVNFLSFAKVSTNKYNANVQVRIMNKTQKYLIQFAYNNGKLIGKKNVKFSDFNITPPSKLGGAVTVKNELNLNFSINTKL